MESSSLQASGGSRNARYRNVLGLTGKIPVVRLRVFQLLPKGFVIIAKIRDTPLCPRLGAAGWSGGRACCALSSLSPLRTIIVRFSDAASRKQQNQAEYEYRPFYFHKLLPLKVLPYDFPAGIR